MPKANFHQFDICLLCRLIIVLYFLLYLVLSSILNATTTNGNVAYSSPPKRVETNLKFFKNKLICFDKYHSSSINRKHQMFKTSLVLQSAFRAGRNDNPHSIISKVEF